MFSNYFRYELGQTVFLLCLIGVETEGLFDYQGRDATKHFSEKEGFFSEKGGGNSVNEGFGKDFYREGNSVKRFGPFSEPPDSEN